MLIYIPAIIDWSEVTLPIVSMAGSNLTVLPKEIYFTFIFPVRKAIQGSDICPMSAFIFLFQHRRHLRLGYQETESETEICM